MYVVRGTNVYIQKKQPYRMKKQQELQLYANSSVQTLKDLIDNEDVRNKIKSGDVETLKQVEMMIQQNIVSKNNNLETITEFVNKNNSVNKTNNAGKNSNISKPKRVRKPRKVFSDSEQSIYESDSGCSRLGHTKENISRRQNTIRNQMETSLSAPSTTERDPNDTNDEYDEYISDE